MCIGTGNGNPGNGTAIPFTVTQYQRFPSGSRHAPSDSQMDRRSFLRASAALAAAPPAKPPETVYHFSVGGCAVTMTIEFYDRYRSAGFWFNERRSDSSFCLSAQGETGGKCLANFQGALAIARYRIRPHSKLREHVRTIDQDHRLVNRPPFERSLSVVDGVVSDIQAFGYEGNGPAELGPEPWCFLRQDLYFDMQQTPFVTVHWKHSLSAIRLLDVIPGITP